MHIEITVSARQGPSSLVSTIEGTLLVDVGASTIMFPGSSVGVIRMNGAWEPGVGGVAGRAPANFAGQASSFLGNAKGALRNARFDVVSPGIPLTQGTFPAAAVIFAFRTNSAPAFDYLMNFILGNQAGTVHDRPGHQQRCDQWILGAERGFTRPHHST